MGARAPQFSGKNAGTGPQRLRFPFSTFMKRFHSGLAVKLAGWLVISIGLFFALFGYLHISLQRKQFEEMVLQSADNISDLILRSTRHDMMQNDREGLHVLINDIGSEPGIQRVRIFNEEGQISFSTVPNEINTMVDKGAEACYACHAQEEPLHKLERPDRARIFQEAGGVRTLAVIRPIENQPDCSSAACHAHPPERRILGVVDAHLSLEQVDQQVAEHLAQLRNFTLLGVALVSLLSVLFVWTFVHRPVRALMAGTKKVAKGDLRYRIHVDTKDELGELAASFNKMTADLAKAHSELTEWARTLEERVRRKGAELERAHSSLVAAEKMASLGKLAATVAHEVNNPLFGMLTYARLTMKNLQKAEIGEEQKKAMLDNLRIIERESRRCGDLMKNLLTFARQAPPNRAANNLNVLVERALELVLHKLELQGITLKSNLDPDLPVVPCDAGQIQQVLLVLLVNATEAMPTGGGTIWVTTEKDEGTDSVLCRVRDSGPGIPTDILPQVFEPFFTTKEGEHRTGLGLAIAKSILEQHGGSIAVESVEGKGAEFTVTLGAQPAAVGSGAAVEAERS